MNRNWSDRVMLSQVVDYTVVKFESDGRLAEVLGAGRRGAWGIQYVDKNLKILDANAFCSAAGTEIVRVLWDGAENRIKTPVLTLTLDLQVRRQILEMLSNELVDAKQELASAILDLDDVPLDSEPIRRLREKAQECKARLVEYMSMVQAVNESPYSKIGNNS